MNYQKIRLDGQWYYFACKLTNVDGYEFYLDWENLVSFVLTDNVLQWGHSAVLVFRSTMNYFERRANPYQTPPPAGEDLEEKFVFRNDHRDTFLIHLEPAPIPDSPPFPDTYTFDMEFVVIDRFHNPSNSPDFSFTTLVLEEMDIHQMYERSIQWSTATANLNPYHGKPQNRMTDFEREMQTGLAIKDLLETTGRKWDGAFWDDGITREFYSSYGNTSVGGIIEHMLKHHLSEATPHDMCLFWKDRVTQLWRLWPISKICEKAGNAPWEPGEWETTHAFLQTKENDVDIKFYIPFSPQWKESVDDMDLAAGRNSMSQFEFSDANPKETTNAISPVILTARDRRKIFYYDTSAIPQNIEDYINMNYTAKKYVEGLNIANPYNLAQKKLEEKRIEWTTHPDKYGRRNDSICTQVWNKIMHGGGMAQMTIKGDSHIRAGTFIGVDAKHYQETKYDYRQFGTFFIIQSITTLHTDSLYTEIQCVKPEAFRSMELENAIA